MVRTSVVGSVKVLSAIFEAVLHFGDTRYIQAKTNVFALQRERADFRSNELPLQRFPLFRRPIPQLSPYEDIRMVKRDTVPTITVGAVKIIAVSTSAVILVGSCVCVEVETRILHIRQFLPPPGGGAGAGAGGAESGGAAGGNIPAQGTVPNSR